MKIKVSAYNHPYPHYGCEEYVEIEITDEKIKELAVSLLGEKYFGSFDYATIDSVELT